MALTDAICISIFISFPEAILVLLIGFSLCDMNKNLKPILLISVLQSLVAFVIIYLKINFGLHSIFQMLSLWILVSSILKIKYYKAIIPVLIGFFVQGILQGIYFPLINLFYDIDFIRLGLEFNYTFLLSIPIYLVSVIILYIATKKKWTLCRIEMDPKDKKEDISYI